METKVIASCKINDTKAVKSHFRGNPKYGRSTQLIDKRNGIVLVECMGVCTRKELWAVYIHRQD